MTYIPQQNFSICAYSSGSGALVNLEVDGSGDYSPPSWTYKPYSKQIVLGDGSVRGAGWATAEWRWDNVITKTQRDWLRNYIPGQSAEVWIKSKTMDDSLNYAVFRAIAIWPVDSETLDTYKFRNQFVIRFQRLTSS